MSTQNTETLNLYKNTKLYNGSRYQFYLTNREQAFLTFLGTPGYTKTVYYKSISEPITINESIKDCDEYTYGSITNDGKTYYFFVDSITTDAYKQTQINYTVDWWTTNWSKIDCTKAHISRQNIAKPNYMVQPISDLAQTITTTSLTNEFTIWATYIPSADKATSFISYIIMEGNKKNADVVDLGFWNQVLGISGSDIKDCFIVPLYSSANFPTDTRVFYVVNSANKPDNQSVIEYIEDYAENFYLSDLSVGSRLYDTASGIYYQVSNISGGNVTVARYSYPYYQMLSLYKVKSGYGTFEFKMFHIPNVFTDPLETMTYQLALTSTPFISTEKKKQGILDWNGNVIWEAPIGYSDISFNTRLLLGISHVMIEFLPVSGSDSADSVVGKGFCYDCRHPGLFVDSYQEYIMKNRDYDIQMRQIQSDKQVTQAAFSTAENMGFGFAFGGPIGSVASGVGGLLETAGTYLLNREYDPKIQKQYDLRYSRMTDQISLVGDSITNVLFALANSTGLLRKYELSVSTDSATRYDNDITANGYYTDESTTDLKSKFAQNVIIQADNVVVEGACNVVGKQQVVYRLQNGVEFI